MASVPVDICVLIGYRCMVWFVWGALIGCISQRPGDAAKAAVKGLKVILIQQQHILQQAYVYQQFLLFSFVVGVLIKDYIIHHLPVPLFMTLKMYCNYVTNCTCIPSPSLSAPLPWTPSPEVPDFRHFTAAAEYQSLSRRLLHPSLPCSSHTTSSRWPTPSRESMRELQLIITKKCWR